MSELQQVDKELRAAWAAFEGRSGQARMLLSQLKEVKEEVDALTTRIEDLSQISALLSTYADDQQETVQKQIESIVSTGLQTIFQEDLSLKIVNSMNGRRPETDFFLISHVGEEVLETSILDARGGGVAAIAGFLIQAVLVILTPNLRPVLFLDEVFSQVSEEYLPPLSDFIKELIERSGLQVVLVTHSDVFSENADKIYRFSQVNGITKVG